MTAAQDGAKAEATWTEPGRDFGTTSFVGKKEANFPHAGLSVVVGQCWQIFHFPAICGDIKSAAKCNH